MRYPHIKLLRGPHLITFDLIGVSTNALRSSNSLQKVAKKVTHHNAGTIPACEVTVQISPPYNITNGSIGTILNLIFTNW